jgi:hypothetical protein
VKNGVSVSPTKKKKETMRCLYIFDRVHEKEVGGAYATMCQSWPSIR